MVTSLTERVEFALEKCRPYLAIDEGGVELVSIDQDAHIVEVRFLGACKACPLKLMTLRAGIERMINAEAPEIKRIEEVV